MTKMFEEELKDREAETFSYWDGCTISKKEFINYADVVNLSQGWVSPEEYEKLVKNCAVYVLECKNINRVNAQLTKENENLKSQLQQQALPVVPECVAEWIDKNISVAHNAELMIHNILICAIDNKNRYLFPLEVEKFVLKNPITFLNAIITGKYEVEKPQLFYLKNKLTGLNLVLEQSFNATGKHVGERFREFDMQYIATDEQEARLYKNTFSKAEIKNMDAGSYEQIEVAE